MFKIEITGATHAEFVANLLATAAAYGPAGAAQAAAATAPAKAATTPKEKPADKPATVKEQPAQVQETVADTSSTQGEASEGSLTSADVLKRVLAYASATNKATAEGLLSKFSASKVSELDPGDYAAVVAAIDEAESANGLA